LIRSAFDLTIKPGAILQYLSTDSGIEDKRISILFIIFDTE